MLKVLSVTATPQFSKGFMHVSFEIANTMEELTDYQFDILRSDASNGDFELIAINVQDFQFEDYSVNLANQQLEYYYKIRVVDKDTDEILESDIASTVNYSENEYVNYLRYVNKIYLEDVINNPKVKYLKKKKFGQYCSECYDDVREKPRKQNCKCCYGTKFEGGYYKPVEISVNYLVDSSSKQENLGVTGINVEEGPIQLWTSEFPIISPGDILVFSDGTRFRVVTWSNSDRAGRTLRQTLQAQKIPYSDIIYKFPV